MVRKLSTNSDQVLFDVGAGQFVAFMEFHNLQDIPTEYDTGINEALGVPNMFYHFACGIETLPGVCDGRRALNAQKPLFRAGTVIYVF